MNDDYRLPKSTAFPLLLAISLGLWWVIIWTAKKVFA